MTNYWKIRALALLAAQAQDESAAAINRFREALKAEGLDPSKPYRYDDMTETLHQAAAQETKIDVYSSRKG